ncbi:IclR family transcriptional regulator C-terminal domain-containing protein [Streptomyces sp. NPDC056983]|uniref:IclR family transcriptional regulator domain-containing protein n=1 Tax=Streptomyces sp. NPDC056983 TaxID=3345987 RepID=UPI00362AB6F2
MRRDSDGVRSSVLENEQPSAGGHKTINRVTRILEEVVRRPGSTFAELTRALDAPKSSVYGFIRGLLAADWLTEQDHKLYLGPAFFSLAIASGQIRAGLVNTSDIEALHQDTGLTASIGVLSGDHLLYVAEESSDLASTFAARANIRRDLLMTAGGKALLSQLPEAELASYLLRRENEDKGLVDQFLEECPTIRRTRIAIRRNVARGRTAVGTFVQGKTGAPLASVTVVGSSADVEPRLDKLSELLLERVRQWSVRSSSAPREIV